MGSWSLGMYARCNRAAGTWDTTHEYDLSGRRTRTEHPDGTTETFSVRPDVDLSRHKVGERVIFRVTEMIAIWVEKPQ